MSDSRCRGDSVLADYRKWPDRQHYRFPTRLLGEDTHGVWLGIPAGTAYNGGPRQGTFLTANVLLVPRTGWWTAKFRPPDAEVSLYVDVCAPPRWGPNGLVAIDLDLDVLRSRDGAVRLVDKDEFDHHRSELAYPEWLAQGALRAADGLMASVLDGREPFGSASLRWLRCLADLISDAEE